MKTMIKQSSFAWIAVVGALAWGCKDDNDKYERTPAQKQADATAAAQDNSQIILTTQEMMDVTAGAFAEKGITEGRTITQGRESNWGCLPSVSGSFNLNTSFADSLIYTGSITLDYGNGDSCPDSLHRRTGKITDTFVLSVSLKNKWTFSSSETIQFEGFHKDSIQVDGIVIIKSATKTPTSVEAQEAKITYPDGTFVSWNGILNFDFEKEHQNRDWGGKSITVTGALNGMSRSNGAYTATITKGIEFKSSCSSKHRFIPLLGTVEITTDGTSATLDYGDGTCDKTYTITTGGTTTVHTWDKSPV